MSLKPFYLGAVIFAFCLVIASCKTNQIKPGTVSSQICSSSSGTSLAKYADLTKPKSIIINDEWMGLSLLAPIKAHYTLKRSVQNYAGNAEFSVGGGFSNQPHTATKDIVVPDEVIGQFLQELGKTPVDKGKYKAKITHTDDYTNISIEISLEEGKVVLSSASQGKDMNPWRVTSGQLECVSPSGFPAIALDILGPYLQRDAQKKLIEEVQKLTQSQRK